MIFKIDMKYILYKTYYGYLPLVKYFESSVLNEPIYYLHQRFAHL